MFKKFSLMCILLGCLSVSHAAEYTWTGNAGDNNWSTSNNWDLNNGYYPQSGSDYAVINPGNATIIWASSKDYYFNSAVQSIKLGAGNTLIFDAENRGGTDFGFTNITLGGGATFAVLGNGHIGYNKQAGLTINYGTFTATSHGLFDLSGINGYFWNNGKTVTLTGTFDTTGLTESGSFTIYDATGISHQDGAPTFNISGLSMILADGVTAEIVTSREQVLINYTVAPVPEPTTATLSLLALAGLAARRRRK